VTESGWCPSGLGADADWGSWAHGGQVAPPGDWRTWVLMAGRGFGKTLAGAQWVRSAVTKPEAVIGGGGEALEIALVGATIDEARRVMVDGRSGLLTVAAERRCGLTRRSMPRSGARAKRRLPTGHQAAAC
jgi:phage terminase large subunit-like protein